MDEIQAQLYEERKIPILKILYRNLLFIIIATILFGVLGMGFGKFFAKPVYTAKCNMILAVSLDGVDKNGAANNDNAIAKNFLGTVLYTVKNSATVFEDANADYANKATNGSISAGAFSTSFESGSTIFTMMYTDSSEQAAKEKLAELIKSCKNYIKVNGTTLVQSTYIGIEETQSKYTVDVNDKFVLYAVIGFAGGLILSAGLVLILYIVDNKVKYPEEIEELTETNVLAYIENID